MKSGGGNGEDWGMLGRGEEQGWDGGGVKQRSVLEACLHHSLIRPSSCCASALGVLVFPVQVRTLDCLSGVNTFLQSMLFLVSREVFLYLPSEERLGLPSFACNAAAQGAFPSSKSRLGQGKDAP